LISWEPTTSNPGSPVMYVIRVFPDSSQPPGPQKEMEYAARGADRWMRSPKFWSQLFFQKPVKSFAPSGRPAGLFSSFILFRSWPTVRGV
jgi:hypothetical protein